MKKILLLFAVMLASMQISNAQSVSQKEVNHNIVNLSPDANVKRIAKEGKRPGFLQFRDDYMSGRWSSHQRYSIEYPASGCEVTHINMYLSHEDNRGYKNGGFLNGNDPMHVMIYDNVENDYAPIECANFGKITIYQISDCNYRRNDIVVSPAPIVVNDPCNCPDDPIIDRDIPRNDGVVIIGDGMSRSTGNQGIGLRVSPEPRYSREIAQDLNYDYAKTVRVKNPLNTGRAAFGLFNVRPGDGWMIDVPLAVGTFFGLDALTGNGIDIFGAIPRNNNGSSSSNEEWFPNDSNESYILNIGNVDMRPITRFDTQTRSFTIGFGARL